MAPVNRTGSAGCKIFRSQRLFYEILQLWFLYGFKSDRAPRYLYNRGFRVRLPDSFSAAGSYYAGADTTAPDNSWNNTVASTGRRMQNRC